ncbi:MAG: hypothetical protein QNJ36_10195 [Calothrix sp. MO_167.B42]|nr:hypothetical protein [Calothrix sp. MO_167.B42]
MVTIASFADLGKTIQQQVPWLPEFWRIRASREAERIGQFKIRATSPIQNIQSINCRVLIVHGKKDTYIPFANGKKLFAIAPSPKEFYAVAEAGGRGSEGGVGSVGGLTTNCQPSTVNYQPSTVKRILSNLSPKIALNMAI